MWREGLTPNLIAWLLTLLALSFGTYLGARALIDPKWAARLVRLKADDAQPGGFAEFRATYGGVFLGLHGLALLITLHWVMYGQEVVGSLATGAVLVLSAGWFGAAFGRAVSMWRDGTRTQFNVISCVIEATIGLFLASPWIAWFISP
ncbi:MAG: DUF4345 family protein [Pseudomonadota bacterium]